jgi:hypothetical protein
VFDIDIEHCPHCGGTLKIIAAIEDPPVIAKILTHLGLSISAPPRATFAIITTDSKRPDSNRSPIHSGSAPEPTSPLTFTRARRQTASKFGTEGRFMARKVPDLGPRTRVIDTPQVQQYFPF